ncbi:MAG TPA: ROK family protein [Acidimicrobiia bacterium]|jgi:fructokinase|nr:ROK family protein [Acidimicrobiia bacterium]
MTQRFGALEAGGTKFVCAVGSGPDDLSEEVRFPTTDPATTMARTIEFFTSAGPLDAVGIASFGPVELRRTSESFGFITTTPKPGWSNTDVAGPVAAALGVPVGFDTDVNGAALGEGRWGAAQGLDTFVYVTVGTGLGGGALVGGRIAHGLVHAEMGHVSVRRMPHDDFPGICPFHGDCFEGMAAGPAIAARWGRPATELADDELAEAVRIESFYIAAGLRNIVYTIAPQRIIVGGGVAKMPGLLGQLRRALRDTLARYPGLPEHDDDDFVVPPGLGDHAGIAGALVLAELALHGG